MTIENVSHKGHVVLLTHEAWSHARTLCVLATRIVCASDVHVTLLVSREHFQRAEVEVSRGFEAEVVGRRKWLRLVAMPTAGDFGQALLDGKESHQFAYHDSFERVYASLVKEMSITCFATKEEMPPAPAPSIVVIDFSVLQPFQAVRKLSKRPVKAVAFYSGASHLLCLPFAPVEYGGLPDKRAKILEEVERTGKPIAKVAFEHCHNFDDTIVNIPGLPPMHHYEFDPQDVNALLEPIVGIMWMSITSVMQEYCDAVITTSPEVYEPEGTAQIREWMHGTNRDVWCLGPLLHLQKHHDLAAENKLSENANEIEIFMDKILQERGAKSLLYISFGSIFWPFATDKLWAFLDVVMEKNIPFILSHASPFAVIPEEVFDKVKTYGNGLLTKWSPQQTVLAHPVLGWFLTHGGQNSVTEAITQGVPLICWPFHADQPHNSIHLSQNFNVAYELLEIRTGKGLLPLYRTGKAPMGTIDAIQEEARRVLDLAWGEDGKQKRDNMKRLQDQVLCAWDEDGPAKKELERFVASAFL